MDTIKFFRGNAAMECSCWPAKHKVILEIAPAFPDKPKGQPQPGSKLYDYSKKIKISFNPNDILTFAYALHRHAQGQTEEFKKMADMAKVANSTDTDKKSLAVNLNDKGGVGFFITKGAEKQSIILNKCDAYALAKWLETTYTVFYIKFVEGGDSNDEDTTND